MTTLCVWPFRKPKAQQYLLEQLHQPPLKEDHQEFQDQLSALEERFFERRDQGD